MDIRLVLDMVFLWILSFPIVKGKIRCACSTLDCYAERRKFCEADTQCYVENLSSVVTRGCIDDKTPILCDNRKSTKLAHLDFPLLYCCKEEFCNRRVVPTEQPSVAPDLNHSNDDDVNPYVRYEYEDEEEKERQPCQNTSDSKLNPIYIAVPIAGVCVLLGLIIFAMYLLRRRNDMYAQYDAYRYQEHMATLANKQNEAKMTQSCETPNRCTDSERFSGK
ncbi:BMP and activin membrane-bound inhibitor homolog [Mya arenaria]|uniref:BMP and activin membrane-bound inhibitor homolog n=1 Tax=Mya arenaria TaxID=6604 RepID=UPI0022E74F36|nr:BMP and activin membrane-bound inhibitor homolog [Mya arenaria]